MGRDEPKGCRIDAKDLGAHFGSVARTAGLRRRLSREQFHTPEQFQRRFPDSGFDLAGTLPGPFDFTMYTVGTCYKARRVPTADPVSDLAGWYRSMMPDLGYKMNYERPFFTEGLEEKVCGKYLRVPKTWGHRQVEQAWSAAWEEREGIFCPTVWVTAWSTKAGDVYIHFAEAATCPL